MLRSQTKNADFFQFAESFFTKYTDYFQLAELLFIQNYENLDCWLNSLKMLINIYFSTYQNYQTEPWLRKNDAAELLLLSFAGSGATSS